MTKQHYIKNTEEHNGKQKARYFDNLVNSHRIANGLTPIVKAEDNEDKE